MRPKRRNFITNTSPTARTRQAGGKEKSSRPSTTKENTMAENNKKYRFETLQLHVGQEQADPATDS
ncbi:MAG: hypothetical protein ACLUG0_07745, partial [Bifidobacterium longum]